MNRPGTYSPTHSFHGVIMVVDPFEKYWLEYDKWYDEHPEVYRSELWAVELSSRNIPRPWLEIGVGSGRFAAPLGIDVGVDPSEKLLELASARGVKTVRGVGENLPFPDSMFGGVFIIITLCFLDDPATTLRESWRVLRGGGKLVVAFIRRDSPWGLYYSRLREEGHRFYSHAKFYTLSEVEDMLSEAGFRVESVVSTLSYPPGGAEVLEPPSIGIKETSSFIVIRAGKRL
ncbi:class I SAM-dependent methyltransferase [Thermogladius sp. 4427co]|uniref:class I SAM-dependent methyltransferase n=1 Tax=Thermogladius sp. 4427co TaxID=3450718 RepID=UPI003F7A0C29